MRQRTQACTVLLLVLLSSWLLCLPTDAKRSKWLKDEPAADAPLAEEDVTGEGSGADAAGDRGAPPRQSTDIAHLNRGDQILLYEGDLDELRNGPLARAINAVHVADAARKSVKGGAGWFPDAATKARIASLDAEVARRTNELATVQQEEKALVSRLKPLFGIVSIHFAAEQKQTMARSLKTIQEMSYNQAWYSSLFKVHRAESLTDILLGFFVEWLMGYVIMYPFAVLYYGLWTLPWSIFEYSSGAQDVVAAAAAYVLALSIMVLPLVLVVGGVVYFVRNNKDFFERMAAERQQRQQQRAQFGRGIYQ